MRAFLAMRLEVAVRGGDADGVKLAKLAYGLSPDECRFEGRDRGKPW
jgi:hypothetical protein